MTVEIKNIHDRDITEPYLVINGKKIWHSAYNKTLDRNILVSQSFGSHAGGN